MPELTSETSFLVPILIFLAAAVVFAPSVPLAGLGSVIGYLAAGMVIGPSGLGLIADPHMTLNISQLGVVLLLFLIGLSLKPARLRAMRRDIGVLGRRPDGLDRHAHRLRRQKLLHLSCSARRRRA